MVSLFQALFNNYSQINPWLSFQTLFSNYSKPPKFNYVHNEVKESYKVNTAVLPRKGIVEDNAMDYDKDVCKINLFGKYKPIKYNEGGKYGCN